MSRLFSTIRIEYLISVPHVSFCVVGTSYCVLRFPIFDRLSLSGGGILESFACEGKSTFQGKEEHVVRWDYQLDKFLDLVLGATPVWKEQYLSKDD
ncbi:hypothetical protein CEXT_11621 [Caerostris extrusa]|uniref:Uncharacterized protein n=1 Tax=Caerostris extrusa TaxID=172846 RepID=A0AAV4XDX9_CAEEX|nr:hypothetical protein CEXT_11621 [Caerostris extrusa]